MNIKKIFTSLLAVAIMGASIPAVSVNFPKISITANAEETESPLRACSVSFYVRIFEQNFVSDKEKIRRNTVVLQGFLTQSMAKIAERTCGKRC